MKKMKKYMGIAAAAFLCFTSCTGNFEDMNTNPLGVNDDDLNQDNNSIGQHFTALQQSIYFNFNGGSGTDWTFQLFQNLNADIWSGYMAIADDFKGGVNNMTYALAADWNDYCWNETYNHVMTNSLRVHEKCEAQGMDKYYHFDAINTIIRVMAMSRICDQYGAVIYSHYGESMTGGVYDTGIEAYKLFFSELDDAVKSLEKTIGNEVASFSKFDMAYGGDYKQWMKLANSLRLRLAMRVVKYDAALAKEQAEAAIKGAQGLVVTGKDIFKLQGQGYRHPLYTISGRGEWNNVFINANMVSIMGGYEDSRLAKYGTLNPDNNVMGIRSGIADLDAVGDTYKAVISNVNITRAEEPVVLFTSAETYFLLAEAALRGWNAGGSAKSFYEEGIRQSFSQWEASMGEYLENTNKPAAWVDPVRSDYNISAVSTVTPKWDDAKTDEERLEKIITQKWIAGFPEGMNAWAELRRTGYPKQFPIITNASQGTISTELGVRRLPFTINERSDNADGYAKAVQSLGGPDNGATRVFWDMNKSNF